MPDQRRTARWLTETVAELLRLPAEEVQTDVPFSALGLSSLQVVELSEQLQRWAGVELKPTAAYDHPAIDDIAAHVAVLSGESAACSEVLDPATARPSTGPVPVAIVGIGCRLPQAKGPKDLWRSLIEGTDAIREVPADRWDADACYGTDTSTPGRTNARWGGFLDDIEGFDAEFHGVSAREAARMDPQQRITLEVAWEALEDAGIPAATLAGSRTGVFMGVSTFDHGTALWGTLEDPTPHDGTGGALSIVANRLSYLLDLHGPSMVVDTACSSSLVAAQLACQALRAGEAELALAGGVNVITSPRIALSFGQGGLMAADGRCKPFDHRADGYVRSEGAGVLVLKLLPRALADRDRIYAVVRGGAVSQDGRTNGLTAPNGRAQEELLRAACAAAGVAAADIGYVEAHGTGTAVGDPVEVAALGTVLGRRRPKDRPLWIGSVKSNLGHLEAAAGVVGLIKTALSLHYRQIPPTVHYEQPNPLLGLDQLPVRVVGEVEPWPQPAGAPAAAGVSSFGFGGTIAHLVLDAAPQPAHQQMPAPDGAEALPQLVPVSARSHDALLRRADAWSAEARTHVHDPGWLARAAAAAALRTDHARQRAAVVAADAGELADALSTIARGSAPRPGARREPKVALVFPGQGPQWAGMGRRLAATVPSFREAITRADAAIARHLGRSLWSAERGLVVEGTAQVQPALFAIQVAIAATWRDWGLKPAGVIGHSMGEIAAAHVAGALSLDDAARLVCVRSRLLTELSGLGGLALVELTARDAAALVEGREGELSVAALNGPRATVLSGTPEALEDVLARLAGQGVFARRISVEFAAHSPQVEALQPRLRTALASLTPRDAGIGLYSTVTGEPVAGQELDEEYWVRNLRAPVLFGPTLDRVLDDGFDTFVEITPHPVLAGPIADVLAASGHAGARVISSLRRDEDELSSLLGAVGAWHTTGGTVDWHALHPGTPAHTALPGHGWRHQHFPIVRLPASTAGRSPAPLAGSAAGGSLLGRRIPVGVDPGLRLWELPLGLDSAPELVDHVVEDSPVVPGAYWLTAATEAAGAIVGGNPVALFDVTFPQPYPLGAERQPALQLGARPDGVGRHRFAISSFSEPDGRTVTHAEGLIGELPAGTPPGRPGTLAEIRGRCSAEVPVEAHYARLEAVGLHYGKRFRALERLFAGAGEALACVRQPEGLTHSTPTLHPAFLDGCLHTIAAATTGATHGGALPLPVAADLVWARSQGPPIRTGWCHARVREADSRHIIADVTVLDDAGEPVWRATGFRLLLGSARRHTEDGRVYEAGWQPYRPGPTTAEPGSWMLVADASSEPLARSICERLTRAGARCAIVAADGGGGTGTREALRGVIDVRAAGATEFQGPQAELRRTKAALHLAQQVTGATWQGPAPRLWLLTAGTQPRPGDTRQDMPAGAALWGLGRTVANEYPEQGCSLVDLERPDSGRDLAAVISVLLSARPPVQVTVRDGALAVPVLAGVPGSPAAELPALRPDRSYVVTGGLGGLGLQVARRLVDRGARQLLLLGRSSPLAAAGPLAELGASGCDVRVVHADAADAEQMRKALHGTDGPSGARLPIGGVFHLAGVLEDALLPGVTDAALTRTFAGKVAGAWNLHQATRSEPVGFFVLFSSLAGMIGSPGQGAYAAANSFLDALAAHRSGLGLPGQSISWGTWAGAGLAEAGGGRGARLAARGMQPLTPATALELLDEAILSGRTQTTVAAFAPEALARHGVWPAARDLLAPLLPLEESGPQQANQGSTRGAGRLGAARDEILAPGAEAHRPQRMTAFLTEQVRQVLGAQQGSIPADVPFQELGMDSLMAIELRHRLEVALGLRLSATLVYAHPTAKALGEQLLTRLEPATPAPPGADLAHLNDSEVVALLAAELDAFKAMSDERGTG